MARAVVPLNFNAFLEKAKNTLKFKGIVARDIDLQQHRHAKYYQVLSS